MMYNIQTTETAFVIKIDGKELTVDFSKMHASWITAHLRKAAQRYLNDKYSGEDAAIKYEAIAADLHAMHSGAPMPEKERKASVASKADPVRKLARDLATTDLVATFKRNAKALGADEKAWALHETTAKYFRTTEKGSIRFDLDEVDNYIERAKVRAKEPKDFLADAKAQIDAASAATENIDLSDLGL
jgi:hypothetical protein